MTQSTEILPSWTCGPGRVVTAQSYMIDRFAPGPEILALDPRATGGGEVSLSLGPLRAAPPEPAGLARQLRRKMRGQAEVSLPGPFIDLRAHAPGNWAHFLNNHLPFAAYACRRLGLELGDLTLVLPETTPAYIRKVAELFGVTFVCTAAEVTGIGIGFALRGVEAGQASGWTVFRAVRPHWAADPWLRLPLERALTAKGPQAPLPDHIFLARRDTRALTNQAQIEALLAPMGHVTIYPEDLSPADQLRLFQGAREIVAVHGAGLAPLLYRRPDAPPARLVEIMPVGHMTDVYRMMAGQMGLAWVGVRGRIRPEHIDPAYDLTKSFTQFSLENFSADPLSVKRAIEMVRAG